MKKIVKLSHSRAVIRLLQWRKRHTVVSNQRDKDATVRALVTSARNKPQTSSCYIRSLRAIYNKAMARRRVKDRRPFRNVFTGNDRTVKRSIDNTDLCRLYSLQLPKASHLCLARDLFLSSFYAMGMPLIDIAHLRRSDIKSGYIVYNRHKTGRQVRVKIEKCMEYLLCQNGETATAHSPDDYLFPILNRKKHPIPSFSNEQQRMASYASFLSYYNRTLKHLARLAGITAPLTSYTPRHTWASLAYRNNVELPVISKALGHTNPTTTLTYISEIGDNRMAQANEKLLNEIFVLPLINEVEFYYKRL